MTKNIIVENGYLHTTIKGLESQIDIVYIICYNILV